MTKSCRTTTIDWLVLAALVLATSCAHKRPAISETIAKTYGLDSFGQIDAIRYTFNAQLGGANITHAWVWEPKTGRVSFEGKDKDGNPVKATYIRSQMNGEPENVKNEIDPAFINDNYWLLFPFHAYWDSSADVRDMGTQNLPLGDGSAKQVVVKYPSAGGGYTPGDTWELYLEPDNRVQEMVYRRGGPKKPSLVVARWAGYKKAGPLLISTDHPGVADGNPLQISFSDVAVKLQGSDTWVNAQ